MLRLINEARADAGPPSVDLGTNSPAQHHADASLAGCLSGHWDVHVLNVVMRYTLAGGCQAVSENVNGSDYCYTASDRVKRGQLARASCALRRN